jgi:hypothetical protein
MPKQPRSYSQFGDDDDSITKPVTPEVESPVSYGSATRGTYEQRTAWRTRDMGRGAPLPYSKRSAGSVYRFDDDSSSAIPDSYRQAEK